MEAKEQTIYDIIGRINTEIPRYEIENSLIQIMERMEKGIKHGNPN